MSRASRSDESASARRSAPPIDTPCTDESIGDSSDDAPPPPPPPLPADVPAGTTVTSCGTHLCDDCVRRYRVALGVPKVELDAQLRQKHYRVEPGAIGDLPDPFQVLRYEYDEHERRLRDSLAQSAMAAQKKAQAGQEHGGKKLSLRRKAKKSAAPANADEALAMEQIEALVLVRQEVARLVKRLEAAHNTFYRELLDYANVRDKRLRQRVLVNSVYALLDSSVVTHPLLADLKLCNNKFFVEMGRSMLQAHMYRYTLAQGRPVEAAMRRFKHVAENADVWLTDRFKDKARDMMPVMWRLRIDTHEHITDDELKYVERRVMRSTPLIMVAILYAHSQQVACEKLMDDLFFYFY